jgi:hypothetical protein
MNYFDALAGWLTGVETSLTTKAYQCLNKLSGLRLGNFSGRTVFLPVLY